MSTEKNLALVRRAIADVWNGLDLDQADALFAPAYVNHGGLIPDLVSGPESIKFAVVLQRTAFPRLHILERALVAEGDLVELEWTARRGPPSRGDSAGATRGIARGTTLMRCTGDGIAESWTTWDCPVAEHAVVRDTSQPLVTRYRPAG